MELIGSISCITDYNGRVSYIRLTGNTGIYAVNSNKKTVGYYDRNLFEHMTYAIKNRFIDNLK